MRSARHIFMVGLAHAFGFVSKALTGQTLQERAERHVRRAYPQDVSAIHAAQAKRARKNAKRLRSVE